MEDTFFGGLLTYGDQVLTWVLVALAAAGAWTLRRIGSSKEVLDVLASVGVKARDVVLEVYQTYVEAIKEGRADGVLTADEKAEALRRARAKLRERLTWREAALLAGGVVVRLFAGSKWQAKLDRLVEGKIEAAIAENKFVARVSSPAPAPKLEVQTRLPLAPPPPPGRVPK